MTLEFAHDLIGSHMTAAVEPEYSGEVTELLRDWRNPAARDRLIALIYPELRRIAALRMRCERSGHTLQPTALVSEVFLHLAAAEQMDWRNRAHFVAVVSENMRRILVDYARRRLSRKRGGGAVLQPVDAQNVTAPDFFHQCVEIDDLLNELEKGNSRVASVFKLHFFVGLTFEQIAEALAIHPRTAKRDFSIARAWLYTALQQKTKVKTNGARSAG
jgi:RNA polymerase sigma factor (TIGR02999 family)